MIYCVFLGLCVATRVPKICQVLLNVFIGAPETKQFMFKTGYNGSLQFLFNVCCDLNSGKTVIAPFVPFAVIYIII